jgi:putative two-component system response regulator
MVQLPFSRRRSRPPAADGSEHALDAQLELLDRLARVAEYRDDDSGRHIYRVAWLSARIGKAPGRWADEVEELYVAAPLPDVGKVAVPDRILLERGPLTSAEHALMRSHTVVGPPGVGGVQSSVRSAEATSSLT